MIIRGCLTDTFCYSGRQKWVTAITVIVVVLNSFFSARVTFSSESIGSQTRKSSCEEYIRHTWSVDLKKKKFKVISKNTVAETICEFPKTSQENTQMIISLNGKVLFQRKIFVSRFEFQDFRSLDGSLSGAKKEMPEILIVGHVPARMLSLKKVELSFVDLMDQKIIARGPL